MCSLLNKCIIPNQLVAISANGIDFLINCLGIFQSLACIFWKFSCRIYIAAILESFFSKQQPLYFHLFRLPLWPIALFQFHGNVRTLKVLQSQWELFFNFEKLITAFFVMKPIKWNPLRVKLIELHGILDGFHPPNILKEFPFLFLFELFYYFSISLTDTHRCAQHF